jgi:hypothetical protein
LQEAWHHHGGERPRMSLESPETVSHSIMN